MQVAGLVLLVLQVREEIVRLYSSKDYYEALPKIPTRSKYKAL